MERALLKPSAMSLSEEHIQNWLCAKIADLLGVPADTIDVTLPFSFYGLDSIAAIGLAGELEELVGMKLSPTLTWDYPTIETMARHLAQQAGG